jgi:hypothetical protein
LKGTKINPGQRAGIFFYQKLRLNYFLVASALAAGLVAGLPLVAVALLFAVGFVAGLAVVDFVVVVVCFDVVVDACADAPIAMVAATNKSAMFLIVFICFVF